MDISVLKNKTIVSIDITNENSKCYITTSDGKIYLMYHEQSCCESVAIDDIEGDLDDLINTPLLVAEEITNDKDSFGRDLDSFLWTFYKFATFKGYVTIRWLGQSNGYYSEKVDFVELDPNNMY